MNKEEFVRCVENLTLCENEGHAINEHINKTCRQLKDRIINEKVPKASAFFKDFNVLSAIKTLLLEDYTVNYCLSMINNDSKGNIVYVDDIYDQPIGFGFKRNGHDWEKGVRFSYSIMIILRRTYKEKDYGVEFVTAYPILEN